MVRGCFVSVIAFLPLVPLACSREPDSRPIRPGLVVAPIVMTVKQRSTTPVPGSNERLVLKVEDVTRGQVMTSLSRDGAPVIAPTSLKEGASVLFSLDGRQYALRLESLSNALIGQDFATFEIRESASEEAKIEHLLRVVATMNDVTLERNGTRHPPAEAADHLRRKWSASAGRIKTAAQFIDEIAATSSMSGEPYLIVWASRPPTPLADHLRLALAKLEATSAAETR